MRTDHGPAGSLALFSDDNRYRFLLERKIEVHVEVERTLFGGRPTLQEIEERMLFACGLNPSTADAFSNDPTITRECGFAAAWRCSTFVKANAYAWRDTVPANMWVAAARGIDVVGDRNDEVIAEVLRRCRERNGIALACWGKHAKRDRVMCLINLARDAGVEWQCLGTNKDGSPKHPLYLPKVTTLRSWVHQ